MTGFYMMANLTFKVLNANAITLTHFMPLIPFCITWKHQCGGCSKVGKPLCYHASNPGSISRGSHTIRSPSRCWANSAFHPFEVGKWVPDNTGANSGSSTMRVAPMDHLWWYDRPLSIYDAGLVGRTMSTKLTEPWFRCA